MEIGDGVGVAVDNVVGGVETVVVVVDGDDRTNSLKSIENPQLRNNQ